MNKLFIVLLAVCLFSVISAHAFVKRDAPASAAEDLSVQVNALKEQLAKLSTDIGKQIAESVNPDVIKKSVNDVIDAATKALEKLKPAEGATPAAQ